jgi:hypothetical protein
MGRSTAVHGVEVTITRRIDDGQPEGA